MLLDALQNFEWLNEPPEIYLNGGLKIVCMPETDFWQSYREDVHKDNGHFFFSKQHDDFEMTAKWRILDAAGFGQCGLMVRIDEFNWFKISATLEKNKSCIISSLTSFGTSDLAKHTIVENAENLEYRIVFKKGGFRAFYSADGRDFIPVRDFDLLKDSSFYMVGAYLSNPSDKKFSAFLEHVEIV